MRFSFFLTLLFSFSPVIRAESADTKVLAIGSDRSFDPALRKLNFAGKDAERFLRAMEMVGQITAGSSELLSGITTKEFRSHLEKLRLSFLSGKNNLKKFIFYFSGHADERGLHFIDGVFSKEELDAFLTSLKADTKIAILDSCFSGSLIPKGIKNAEEFELPSFELDEPSGLIYLVASSRQQFAYESDMLQSGVFTHHLLAGLYGEGDSNRDGLVTADELYQYVYRSVKLHGLTAAAATQKPEFMSHLKGHGAVVLSFPARTTAGLQLKPELSGPITFASQEGLPFFSINKIAGQTKTIRLPVGTYLVKFNQENRQGQALIALRGTGTVELKQEDITWSDTGGKTFAQKGARMSSFGVLGGIKSSFANAQISAPTIDMQYFLRQGQTLLPGSMLYPSLSLTSSPLREKEASGRSQEIAGLVNLSYSPIERWSAFRGILAGGAQYIRQSWDYPDGDHRIFDAAVPTMRLGLGWQTPLASSNTSFGLLLYGESIYAADARTGSRAFFSRGAAAGIYF